MSPELSGDIEFIANKFRAVEAWAVTGSANLCLHGIDLVVNDIDIICEINQVREISKVLSKRTIKKVEYQEIELIKSHFGQFQLPTYCLEVFADDIENRTTKGWVSRSEWKNYIQYLDLGFDHFIPVLSLEFELKIYRRIKDFRKIDLISKHLSLNSQAYLQSVFKVAKYPKVGI